MSKKKRMLSPLFIRNKDIQRVKDCDTTTASLIMQSMREEYKERRHQRVTVAEFATYEGIPLKEVLKRMQ